MSIWHVTMKKTDRFGLSREWTNLLSSEGCQRMAREMFRACEEAGDDILMTVTAWNGEGLTLKAEDMAWSQAALLRFNDTVFEAVEQAHREGIGV